jgi:hypothetical protein
VVRAGRARRLVHAPSGQRRLSRRAHFRWRPVDSAWRSARKSSSARKHHLRKLKPGIESRLGSVEYPSNPVEGYDFNAYWGAPVGMSNIAEELPWPPGKEGSPSREDFAARRNLVGDLNL